MKNKHFNELVSSIKEAGEILRKTAKPKKKRAKKFLGKGVDKICIECGHYQHSSHHPAECSCKVKGCVCQSHQWQYE